jgi:hypothetical protein
MSARRIAASQIRSHGYEDAPLIHPYVYEAAKERVAFIFEHLIHTFSGYGLVMVIPTPVKRLIADVFQKPLNIAPVVFDRVGRLASRF